MAKRGSSFVQKLRRVITAGHAIATVVVLWGLYQVWGVVFQPGGTGSNVVLGLLIALAVLWVGVQQVGPLVDTMFARGEARRLLQARRAALELSMELARAVELERKRKIPRAPAATLDALDEDAGILEELADDAATTADALEAKVHAVDDAAHKALPAEPVSFFAQARSLGAAFAIALALRAFFVAPFQIPSGSMIPTLLIGDHLFVFRGMYGLQNPLSHPPSYLVRWSLPKPGDVIVFEAPGWVPRNAGEDWIKRVVAGAGQHVRQEGTVLYVDGKPYAQVAADGREGRDDDGNPFGVLTRYMDYDEGLNRWFETGAAHKRETIVRPDGARVEHSIFNDMPPRTTDWPLRGVAPELTGLRCTDEECVVEDGYVFVMGDNRDRSSDGRVWGAVPVDNIKGKAIFIWVSVDGSEDSVHLGRFTLPRFRWERIGGVIP